MSLEHEVRSDAVTEAVQDVFLEIVSLPGQSSIL